jgi:hypothetical protein
MRNPERGCLPCYFIVQGVGVTHGVHDGPVGVVLSYHVATIVQSTMLQ